MTTALPAAEINARLQQAGKLLEDARALLPPWHRWQSVHFDVNTSLALALIVQARALASGNAQDPYVAPELKQLAGCLDPNRFDDCS